MLSIYSCQVSRPPLSELFGSAPANECTQSLNIQSNPILLQSSKRNSQFNSNCKTISYLVMSCLQVEGGLQEMILDLANLTLTLASIILSIQFPIPGGEEHS